jgi:hypothetical protein
MTLPQSKIRVLPATLQVQKVKKIGEKKTKTQE